MAKVFLIFSIIFSIRIPFTEKRDDIKTGYTPVHARAFDEMQAYLQFYDGLDPVLLYVIITARDGGSMNRLAHLNQTVALIDRVGKGFPVRNLTFYDICKSFCDANEPVLQYRVNLSFFF
ncbi:unnamed protein product [Anisakis simplex]|uniref:Secreted protein n=1 Tax=Anisakis simplex TaxID=6269 RepID=A0A0M3KA99_ANISI|nr:unnamed protein product [Anisakis simplex]